MKRPARCHGSARSGDDPTLPANRSCPPSTWTRHDHPALTATGSVECDCAARSRTVAPAMHRVSPNYSHTFMQPRFGDVGDRAVWVSTAAANSINRVRQVQANSFPRGPRSRRRLKKRLRCGTLIVAAGSSSSAVVGGDTTLRSPDEGPSPRSGDGGRKAGYCDEGSWTPSTEIEHSRPRDRCLTSRGFGAGATNLRRGILRERLSSVV
jgi:hypothetical protein